MKRFLSYLNGLITGASFSPRVMWYVTTAAARVMVIALPAMLGIIVSFDSSNIANASRRFLYAEWGPPYPLAVLSWSMGIGWMLLLYVRVVTDDYERRERQASVDRQVRERLSEATEALQRAIVRSPDLGIIPVYPHFLRRAAEHLRNRHYLRYLQRRLQDRQLGDALDEQDIADLYELEQRIRNVLHAIAIMSRRFGRRSSAAVYGCTVLLVEKHTQDPACPFHSLARDSRELLLHDRGEDRNWLEAVLYTSHKLSVEASSNEHPWLTDPESDDEDELDLPCADGRGQPSTRFEPHPFALPIPSGRSGSPRFLPGSPEVFKYGRIGVYEDTQQYHLQCSDFSKDVRDAAETYFKPGGLGERIRSFAAFRIGSPKEPVGVLKILCDETYLLGDAREYYATFVTQLAPFLQLLSRPLIVYSGIQTLIWDHAKPLDRVRLADGELVP